jgi:hypothetical protein
VRRTEKADDGAAEGETAGRFGAVDPVPPWPDLAPSPAVPASGLASRRRWRGASSGAREDAGPGWRGPQLVMGGHARRRWGGRETTARQPRGDGGPRPGDGGGRIRRPLARSTALPAGRWRAAKVGTSVPSPERQWEAGDGGGLVLRGGGCEALVGAVATSGYAHWRLDDGAAGLRALVATVVAAQRGVGARGGDGSGELRRPVPWPPWPVLVGAAEECGRW